MAQNKPSGKKRPGDLFASIEQRVAQSSSESETAASDSETPADDLWRRVGQRRQSDQENAPSLWKGLEDQIHLVKARPRLRADLIIAPMEEEGQPCYVVKDPVALKYYRFKENEHFVLTLLDGNHEVRDIVRAYTTEYRPIRPETVAKFLERVEGFGLLEHRQESLYGRLLSRLVPKWAGRLTSLLRLDYAFPDTDRLTQRLYHRVAWTMSTPATWVWGLFALSGLLLIVAAWSRFRASLGAVLGSGWALAGYVAVIYLGMIVVIAVHEFAHALSCVHFGGRVSKMGIMFYYLSLAAYADTSDAWLFSSKWHRTWVSLSGPLSTLVFGALGAWVWWLAPEGSVLSQLAVMAVLSTIPQTFSNLNPFMEFDGYYALSDLTGIANLRQRSFAYCRQWLTRLARRTIKLPIISLTQQRIFMAYGALAAGYFAVFVILPLISQIPYLLRQFGPLLGGVLVLGSVLLTVQKPLRGAYQRWRARARQAKEVS